MTKNNKIAIYWIISRSFVMACIMLIGRLLADGGMSHYASIFWQNAFAFVFVMIFCAFKRKIPTTNQYGLHTLRCAFGLCSGLILFYCLGKLPLNDATAITYTGPLFSTIAAIIFLKEKSSTHRWIGLIIGFIGVLIILRPGSHEFNPIALFLLLTPFIWGLTDVTIKKLIQTDTTTSLLFHMVVIMMVLSIPLGIFFWHTPSLKEAALCASLAAFHLGNFYTISKAFKRADVSLLMPFEFFRLVFTSVFAYFLFHETISMAVIAGTFVIIGSSIYVARIEAKNDK
jgi:drug/metabolite transporter (DMT)-like permease